MILYNRRCVFGKSKGVWFISEVCFMSTSSYTSQFKYVILTHSPTPQPLNHSPIKPLTHSTTHHSPINPLTTSLISYKHLLLM